MKVLFSNVGMSDPMTIFKDKDDGVFDSAILHIVRYYRPDKIYLFMSKEICEFDELDNRYERSIHLLDKNIKVYKIKKNQLCDVQRFDSFYDEYEKNIEDIIKENGEESQILCNVSSGTPAMKSALQILAVFSRYQLIPIQVDDPSKGKSKREDLKKIDLKGTNLEDYWILNKDNEKDSDNRTYKSENNHFEFRIQREIIRSFLDSYDYDAAYKIAFLYKYKLDVKTMKSLEFAQKRSILDLTSIRKINKDYDFNLLPYKKDQEIELFEYALWLNRKVKQNLIIDFLRGLNPFMSTALSYLLKNKCYIDIDKYYVSDNSNGRNTGAKMLDPKKCNDETGKEIIKILSDKYKGFDIKRFITEEQLLVIFKNKVDSNLKKVINSFNNLDKLRKEKRNQASHEIVCVKNSDFKNEVSSYIKDIKNILNALGYDVKNNWDSYDKMNDFIYKRL